MKLNFLIIVISIFAITQLYKLSRQTDDFILKLITEGEKFFVEVDSKEESIKFEKTQTDKVTLFQSLIQKTTLPCTGMG